MTTSNAALMDYWTARIGRDIAPFSDPGTELKIDRKGRTITCTWSQRAVIKQASFSLSHDGTIFVSSDGPASTYRGFFASPAMADLMGLAKMTLQAQKIRPYVETRGEIEDTDKTGLASKLIRDALDDPSAADVTLLVMVTGEAGAGKTSVLQELVRSQANAYMRGQAEGLYLYVNAQGRALARFTEAVAAELDELRSQLTFHQVTPLVRLGLIVPIIDGFDELLGVGGYAEAFSSLAAFIEELDGSGQLIASSRSTYYEQEFVERAGRSSALGAQSWKQTSVRVHEWGEEELQNFIAVRTAEKGLDDEDIAEIRQKLQSAFSGRNESLASKPLFVSQALELVMLGEDFSDAHDLLESLITTYLKREQTEKLVDRNGKPILDLREIRQLLVELAEEMWNQETRELDTRSIRELAEYSLADSNIDSSAERLVVERMPSMAFLAPGTRHSTVAFEHETFFAYFLAQRVAERLAQQPDGLPVLLGRSILPTEVARLSAERLQGVPTNFAMDLSVLLERLGTSGATMSPRQTQVRENAGLIAQNAIVVACMTQHELTDLRLHNIIFPGGDLNAVVIKDSSFENVEFRRVDFRKTRIIASRAKDVLLIEPFLDAKSTRLELAGLDAVGGVFGVRSSNIAGGAVQFDPTQVGNLLVSVGAIPEPPSPDQTRNVAPKVVEIIDKFARAYKRANPICTSDDILASIFSKHEWPMIQKALRRTGVVVETTKSASGTAKVFLRRQVLPEEIMAGIDRRARVPDSVRAFWDYLEIQFPNSGKFDRQLH